MLIRIGAIDPLAFNQFLTAGEKYSVGKAPWKKREMQKPP